MSGQYNQATAIHYSSYRPPLHEVILGRVLSSEEMFNEGLDVGCGTGHSAVALAKYCSHIYGIDPSQSMLGEARPHERITYRRCTGEDLPLPDKSVDIVTFAGSLFYAKSGSLIRELKRVCREQALVIPYDFEVLVDEALLHCGINLEKTELSYDFEVNFSDSAGFVETISGKEQIDLEVTATELAHVLLASSYYNQAFLEKYGGADPFPILVRDLERTKELHTLKVNIYFSKYHLNVE
jgi:SAM-dependent methyltransferase